MAELTPRHLVAVALAWLLLSGSASASPVYAFPSPGSRFATPQTQVSFRGVAAQALGAITVSGARSGVHPGHITPDSDDQGASFYPDRAFVPGELVTVRTPLPIVGGRGDTFTFRIDRPAAPLPQGTRSSAPRVPGDVQTFRSRPDLRPASVDVMHSYAGASDIFLASMQGPLEWGPMIVDPRGSLVWFAPIRTPRTIAADFRVQKYLGRPVLTWWQGIQDYGNPGPNKDVIVDQTYRTITTVRAGNGLTTDLHEFTITPRSTALITAYRLVGVNGLPAGGVRHMVVPNCFVQEIDIPTGNVIFQWDSLDHVPLANAYGKPSHVFPLYDYFHINSVEPDTDGNLVISARNTWAVYKIDRRTGKVLWELGGKHSSFKMGLGARTAFQHDAIPHPGGLITIFDNGGWPTVHQSRAVLERINTAQHTATLVRASVHSPSLFSPWEGSAQLRPGGQVFVGWGGLPQFTEFDRNGRAILDGRFTGGTSSYRAYEYAWHAQPSTLPAVALSRTKGTETTVYVSWNGATEVSRWRVLAGMKPRSLVQIAAAPTRGFETSLNVRTGPRYFAVQAVSASGGVLAQSRTISVGA